MPYASGGWLMGNLANDPKVKVVGETKVAEFAVAVERYVGKGKDNKVSFFDCAAFGKTAEFIGEYFKKGAGIFLEITPTQDRWENSEGQKRSRVVFIVDRATGVGAKKQED